MLEGRFSVRAVSFACLFLLCSALACPSIAGAVDTHSGTVILCLGDSITYGLTQSSDAKGGAQRDPQGGYPGRLQRRLGDRFRVLNRGMGGATTQSWLSSLAALGPKLWPNLPGVWPDFRSPEPAERTLSLAQAVLQAERPDLVIMLLGINDLAVPKRKGAEEVVEETLDRLRILVRQVRSATPTVLVATPLPNRRETASLQEKLRAGVRAAFPGFLPLGERFAAAGWEDLLADAVHPNQRGYAVLAEIVAGELSGRGLVELDPGPTPAKTPAPAGGLPPGASAETDGAMPPSRGPRQSCRQSLYGCRSDGTVFRQIASHSGGRDCRFSMKGGFDRLSLSGGGINFKGLFPLTLSPVEGCVAFIDSLGSRNPCPRELSRPPGCRLPPA